MQTTKFLSLLILLLFTGTSVAQVLTGVEVLRKNNFDILKGKRVGLITNPTGVDRNLVSTIDILSNAEGVKLTALYGPEHGVRGDFSAGDKVDTYTDPVTKIPVYSLYGKTRKPTKEMMKDIDILVFDIQDIGSRSYTYISTMGLAMEAAAEFKKKFVVLDRPNPLGGLKIEGNLAEDGYISFVSQFKVPYAHALTVGELAKFLNGEGQLKGGVKCDLEVVPMEGWKRDMTFDQTGLPWVLTSPHIPYKESAIFYTTSGIMGELGVISEGVGYTLPFQMFGAEWIDGLKFADELNKMDIPGVIFRPLTFKPYYGAHKGKSLGGVQIFITDYKKVNLMSIQFLVMEVNNKFYPDKNPFKLCTPDRLNMFDKVCGSGKIRELFTKRMKYSDIEEYLNKDVESFRKVSSKYYLYK
jgi:uncharacterized protein YbbC (DUF1343 family)